MRDLDNIRALCKLDIQYMGLIFYSKSSRNIEGYTPNEIFDIKALTDAKGIKRVGVFVNEELGIILEKVDLYDLHAVQLHGDEGSDFCKTLREKGLKVIKAFSVDESFDFSKLDSFQDNVDYFLFDTKGKLRGGNGVAFDWAILGQYKLNVPFLLSGGIGPGKLEQVQRISFEQCMAIDVNSGFEIAPGLKNIEALQSFIHSLKQAV